MQIKLVYKTIECSNELDYNILNLNQHNVLYIEVESEPAQKLEEPPANAPIEDFVLFDEPIDWPLSMTKKPFRPLVYRIAIIENYGAALHTIDKDKIINYVDDKIKYFLTSYGANGMYDKYGSRFSELKIAKNTSVFINDHLVTKINHRIVSDSVDTFIQLTIYAGRVASKVEIRVPEEKITDEFERIKKLIYNNHCHSNF